MNTRLVLYCNINIYLKYNIPKSLIDYKCNVVRVIRPQFSSIRLIIEQSNHTSIVVQCYNTLDKL